MMQSKIMNNSNLNDKSDFIFIKYKNESNNLLTKRCDTE